VGKKERKHGRTWDIIIWICQGGVLGEKQRERRAKITFHNNNLLSCLTQSFSEQTLYFRAIMKPQAVEFLVHMSLATAAAAVNSLAEEVIVDEMPKMHYDASVGSQDERYQVSFSFIWNNTKYI
jgi:hypothetical protein